MGSKETYTNSGGLVLRIARAYCTVSTDAAQIVTGIEPLYLIGLFRARLINIKKGCEHLDQIPTCEMEQKAHFLTSGHPSVSTAAPVPIIMII